MEEKYFLRKIKEEDIYDVFQLSNEDYVRKFSINKNKINWNEHVIWFNNIITSDDNVFYVVTDYTNKFLGQLRYKVKKDIATISISLCQSITGKGLSYNLLLETLKLISDERDSLKKIIAFVSDKNIASKKLFEKAEFLLTESNNGMHKYVFQIEKGV